jgi:hypothetical protein
MHAECRRSPLPSPLNGLLRARAQVALFPGCELKPADFCDPKRAKEVDSAFNNFLQDPKISENERTAALNVLWDMKETVRAERKKYGKTHAQIYSALDWIFTIGQTLNESGMNYFLAHNEMLSVENRINVIFANGKAIRFPNDPKPDISLEDYESGIAEYSRTVAALKDENAKLNDEIAKLKATKDEGNKRADYWIRRFFPGSSSSRADYWIRR